MRDFIREKELKNKQTVQIVNVIVCVGPEAAADNSEEGAPAKEEQSPDSDSQSDGSPNVPSNVIPGLLKNRLEIKERRS